MYEWNIIWPPVLAPLSIIMYNLGQHLIANSIVHGLKFNYILRKCIVLLTVTKIVNNSLLIIIEASFLKRTIP